MCTKLWSGKERERDHLRDLYVGGGVNIKMDLRNIGCKCLDWIQLPRVRVLRHELVNTAGNLQFL
jgi:hypothetical protein